MVLLFGTLPSKNTDSIIEDYGRWKVRFLCEKVDDLQSEFGGCGLQISRAHIYTTCVPGFVAAFRKAEWHASAASKGSAEPRRFGHLLFLIRRLQGIGL
jgi:hypothetical protein